MNNHDRMQRIIDKTPIERMTIAEARARGIQYFWSSTCVCPKMHDSPRYTSTNYCCECGLRSTEYTAWANAKQRCLNPKHPKYHAYGGRGIKFSERWMKFENFLRDLGEKPTDGHCSLERISPDGHYDGPQSCVWTTRQRQNYNRRTVRYIDVDGGRIPLSWACQEIGISVTGIRNRAKKHRITLQEAFDQFRANPVRSPRGTRYQIEVNGEKLTLCAVARSLGLTLRAITIMADKKFSGDRFKAARHYLDGKVKRKNQPDKSPLPDLAGQIAA